MDQTSNVQPLNCHRGKRHRKNPPVRGQRNEQMPVQDEVRKKQLLVKIKRNNLKNCSTKFI